MTSLKAIMKAKLDKGKEKAVAEEVSKPKTSGRLQEFFDSTVDNKVDSSIVDEITEEEMQAVIDEGIPYLDEDNPNYHQHVKHLAKTKRDNPTLYAKMKNWD